MFFNSKVMFSPTFSLVSRCPFCHVSRGIKKFPRIQTLEELRKIPTHQYVKEKSKLKRSKHVHSWGLAVTGALGKPELLEPILTGNRKKDRLLENWKPREQYTKPVRVSLLDGFKIYDVAAGYGFSLIAASTKGNDATVYGTGLNSDSQLGYHEYDGKVLTMIIRPTPIHLDLEKDDEVVKVAAGRCHSFMLTKNSKIYSLGNNSFGQCGVPIIQDQIYTGNLLVNHVEVPEKVINIVCGQDHTLFLTENGTVYSCGLSTDGQTGVGNFKNVGVPQKVGGDIEGEKIIQVSSCADGVLALNEKGDVFGWGNSEYNQLGMVTDEMQILNPTHLPMGDVGKVIRVAAGASACAVLNDKNQIFVWGFGILGKGPQVEHSRTPSLIPETIFGCNDYSPDLKLVDIAAGCRHFAAITNEGDLFTWGKNRNGCLGHFERNHGRIIDHFFPMRVEIPALVKKVSLGVDHTIALTTKIL